MLVVLGFYKRNPKLTWQQFSDHWKNVHGPMICALPVARKNMKRYVQHHIRPQTDFPDMAALDFDGFSETWFENSRARQEIVGDADFVTQVREDDKIMLDLSKTRTLMYDTQLVQIGPRPVMEGDVLRFI